MNTKQTELLNYMLVNKQTITSQSLASVLHVSVRSIKSYISQINESANAKVILSDKNGYSINSAIAQTILNKTEIPVPQNYIERTNYIIKQFIVGHTNYIDINDLAESLYISDSTLRLDVKRMDELYSKYSIHFHIVKDKLVVDGSERSLRKMMSKAIYDDVGNNYTNLNVIKEEFKNFDVRSIVPILKMTFAQNNYYINDVALMNLVLHIAIIIDRLLDGRNITSETVIPMQSEVDTKLVNELCSKLESAFGIQFITAEKDELYLLVRTNANLAMPNNLNELTGFVGDKVMDITNSLIAITEEEYKINLSDAAFVAPFALHLKNMIYRSETDKMINNPMIDSITNGHPLVYDIAVFMGIQLLDKYNIRVNESEFSFLALHIGGELERQKINSVKISTVLLCPSYMNLETRLYNNILLDFSNDINIIATVPSLEQVSNLKFDLLMTTITGLTEDKYEIVVIPPFASRLNKVEIQETIEKCKNNIKNRILKNHFDNYFEEDTFFTGHKELKNDEEVIRFLAKNLIKKEYVPQDYIEKVLSRERAASTAFNCIAIPHSMEMNCYRTSVSVLLNADGIDWAGQRVTIVLMMSLSSHDSQEFSKLYEALVVLFSNQSNVDLFEKCKSFNEFKNILYALVK